MPLVKEFDLLSIIFQEVGFVAIVAFGWVQCCHLFVELGSSVEVSFDPCVVVVPNTVLEVNGALRVLVLDQLGFAESLEFGCGSIFINGTEYVVQFLRTIASGTSRGWTVVQLVECFYQLIKIFTCGIIHI